MRKDKPIEITLLCFVEIIISARILLFTIPVLINKSMGRNFMAYKMDDWFILVLTFAAVIYFVVGISSLIGVKFWRLLHYFAAALIFVVTAGLFNRMVQTDVSVNVFYFIPLVFSILTALMAGLNRS